MLWYYCTSQCACSAWPPHLHEGWGSQNMSDLISQQVCGWAAAPAGWSLRCSISPLAKSTGTRKGNLRSGRSEIWKTKSSYPSWDHKWTRWVTILWLHCPTALTWLVCTNKPDGTFNFLRNLPLFLPPKTFSLSYFFPTYSTRTQKKASLCLKTHVSKSAFCITNTKQLCISFPFSALWKVPAQTKHSTHCH